MESRSVQRYSLNEADVKNALLMSKQSKIEIESDAGQLLRQLVIHGSVIIDGRNNAALWLMKRKYARMGDWKHTKLYVEERGRDYYEALCRNPATTESAAAWKEEARSGMTTAPGKLGTITKQSDIQNAVIPSPSPPGRSQTPESIMQDNERDAAARRKLLADLGCSEAELVRYGDEGRIRVCDKCGEVGIFDRDRGSWKPMCRKCRKDRRG